MRVQERESGDEAEIQRETLSTPTVNPPMPKPSSRSKPKLMNLYDTNCGGNCGVWEATSRACDCRSSPDLDFTQSGRKAFAGASLCGREHLRSRVVGECSSKLVVNF